jgi:hypothetical protein
MVDSSFAPLLTPIHGPVPEGHPPWKDNAFLAFSDVNNDLFGSVHVSTSPNAGGRRARFSISLQGKVIEVIEDLASGTFTSESISFEMGAPITVRTPRLSGVASLDSATLTSGGRSSSPSSNTGLSSTNGRPQERRCR